MKITPSLIRAVNVFVGTGISAAYVIGRGFRADQKKESLELKLNGKPASVPTKIQSLINEVLEDMKLDEEEKKKITPFITTSYDLKHVETSVFGKEMYLGIPEHFLLDSNTLNDFIVEVQGTPVPKHSREFESLKRSLSLSDEAKKFAIAHEIYMSNHNDIYPYSILPFLLTFNCCVVSYMYERKSKNVKKAKYLHVHILIFLTGALLYALVGDVMCMFGEGDSDHLAAKLGNSYVKGGIEYYRKMMERNKVFKRLNEKAPYSKNGDIKTSEFRTTHMPLLRRLKYLGEISEGKKSSAWAYIIFYP